MADKTPEPKRISASNTKKEMIDAYNDLLNQLQQKREAELKPQERLEEKAVKQVVAAADALSTDGIVKEIGNLKSEMGKMLAQLSDRLEEGVRRYDGIKKAVAVKEGELQEIYEIEKAASSLAALIEAQEIKRQAFESEMAAKKEELGREIQTVRGDWEKEKKVREAEAREREAAEAKRREREKEEYRYASTREQQLAKDQFEYEKARLERDIQHTKERLEQELAEREKAIAQREEELNQLRTKAMAFPKEMEAAINAAVKEATVRVQLDGKNREELLRKEFDGERNVMMTRIESREQLVKEQSEQIARLSQQLEKAYGQVQDIAVRTVEGSSHSKSLSGLMTESRKQTLEQ
jgi:DNA repair exonuclease SbcCD ATPase subunit